MEQTFARTMEVVDLLVRSCRTGSDMLNPPGGVGGCILQLTERSRNKILDSHFMDVVITNDHRLASNMYCHLTYGDISAGDKMVRRLLDKLISGTRGRCSSAVRSLFMVRAPSWVLPKEPFVVASPTRFVASLHGTDIMRAVFALAFFCSCWCWLCHRCCLRCLILTTAPTFSDSASSWCSTPFLSVWRGWCIAKKRVTRCTSSSHCACCSALQSATALCLTSWWRTKKSGLAGCKCTRRKCACAKTGTRTPQPLGWEVGVGVKDVPG